MLTKSGLVCHTNGLVPRSGPSWLWAPYQTENALLASTMLGPMRRWDLPCGAGTKGASFCWFVLRPCAQLRLDRLYDGMLIPVLALWYYCYSS